MSELGCGPLGPDYSATPQPGEPEPNGSGGWRPPWRRQVDRTEESSPTGVLPQGSASEGPHAGQADAVPDVLLANGAATHLYGKVDVVAGSIKKFVSQTRKLDLLEGVRVDRGEVLSRPFVCEGSGQMPGSRLSLRRRRGLGSVW